jgi:hypothetical protein
LPRRNNGAYLSDMTRAVSKAGQKKAPAKSAGEGRIVVVRPNGAAKEHTVRLGDVMKGATKLGKSMTLTYGSASMRTTKEVVQQRAANIVRGQEALKMAKKKVVKPGVNLRTRKDVPLFFADPSNPKRVIRQLNGKRESGVFEGGTFKAIG